MKKLRIKNVLLYLLGLFVAVFIVVYYHHSTPITVEKTGGARIINTEKVRQHIQNGELTNENARFFITLADDPVAASKH